MTYDLPEELRVQIVHIFRESIGTKNAGEWKAIHDAAAREHGRFSLADGGEWRDRCESYLLNNRSVDAALDLIERCLRTVARGREKLVSLDCLARGITVTADKAIDELNERFRRAGIGYRFEHGNIRMETLDIAATFVHGLALSTGVEGHHDYTKVFSVSVANMRFGASTQAAIGCRTGFLGGSRLSLRDWPHETLKQILPGSAGTGSAVGSGPHRVRTKRNLVSHDFQLVRSPRSGAPRSA